MFIQVQLKTKTYLISESSISLIEMPKNGSDTYSVYFKADANLAWAMIKCQIDKVNLQKLTK